MFDETIKQYSVIILAAVAVGAFLVVVLTPLLKDRTAERRYQSIASTGKTPQRQSLKSRLSDDPKDARRRQIQNSLNQLNEDKSKKKKLDLRTMLAQSGLDITTKMFWFMSIVCGLIFMFVPFVFGMNIFIVLGAGFIGTLGFPRWILKYTRKRRQKIFISDLADAVDVLVRGLKSGLPINDAMRVIAKESGPPVGPEFMEVLDGQKLGIPIDTGIEKLYERMPLPEVNFLAIVMSIQSKTGGNLSEALANLSKVLRDRKKMQAKIRAVSQEAKSSAMIIGALPFAVAGIVLTFNPRYMDPLLHTTLGHVCLAASGVWMFVGILVMKKMMNIDI